MHHPASVWLRRQNAIFFVALLLVASYAAMFAGFTALPLEQADGSSSMQRMGHGWRLVVGSVIVPVIETAIFLWLPIKKLGLRSYWGVLLSASMFGLSHWYSLSYMVATFLVGLVWAYGFAVRDSATGKPFLLVTVAHGIHNAVASVLG